MNPRGSRIPQLTVCLDERVDLSRCQLEPPLAQCGKRFTRLFNELQPQFFVRDDLTDEQLNRFLRHGPQTSIHDSATIGPRRWRAQAGRSA
jgi:hypothetical protein